MHPKHVQTDALICAEGRNHAAPTVGISLRRYSRSNVERLLIFLGREAFHILPGLFSLFARRCQLGETTGENRAI